MKFTKSHEWIKVEQDVAVVGITDHAQNELSDVVFVDLPQVGDVFKQGDVMLTIESVKAASDVYAPISGETVEINESLNQSPEQVNASPEDEGWLIKVRMDNISEVNGLLNKKEYDTLVESS